MSRHHRRTAATATAIVLALLAAWSSPAAARPRPGGSSHRKPGKPNRPVAPTPTAPAPASKPAGGGKAEPKVFDFTGLDLAGRLRSPQLMYFLERAQEELERARLQRRSFMPELRSSVDQEGL